ncbi:hypothetical protein SRABI96_04263 [Peribacillus sp. Bi96]|nr:hypothetical protein SRABI96_04263 [Peribacillus sp. Bi96]
MKATLKVGALFVGKEKVTWVKIFEGNEKCYISNKIYIDNDFHYLLI